MSVQTLLRKEKEGSFYKEMKLACVDELAKIAVEGRPAASLINMLDSQTAPTLPERTKQRYPSRPALPVHEPPLPPEQRPPPGMTESAVVTLQ